MLRTSKTKEKSTANVTMRVTEDLLARIDERRRVEIDIPTRTSMIKRILNTHLDEWEAEQKKHQG